MASADGDASAEDTVGNNVETFACLSRGLRIQLSFLRYPKNLLKLKTIPTVHSDCVVHTREIADKTNCYASTSVVL
jgi:hypothetical protein